VSVTVPDSGGTVAVAAAALVVAVAVALGVAVAAIVGVEERLGIPVGITVASKIGETGVTVAGTFEMVGRVCEVGGSIGGVVNSTVGCVGAVPTPEVGLLARGTVGRMAAVGSTISVVAVAGVTELRVGCIACSGAGVGWATITCEGSWVGTGSVGRCAAGSATIAIVGRIGTC
jgi:trimeric autotransporter adhesin